MEWHKLQCFLGEKTFSLDKGLQFPVKYSDILPLLKQAETSNKQ